jgi:hypothetical protein
MTATDLEARSDRVRAIAECVGGKVIDRNGNTVRIEIPADTAPASSGSRRLVRTPTIRR